MSEKQTLGDLLIVIAAIFLIGWMALSIRGAHNRLDRLEQQSHQRLYDVHATVVALQKATGFDAPAPIDWPELDLKGMTPCVVADEISFVCEVK